VLLLIAAGTVVVWQMIRSRHMQYWLPAYLIPSRTVRRHRRAVQRIVRGVLKPSGRRVPGKRTPASPPDSESLHVFLAVCDHYEPQWGGADRSVALQRIDHWVAEYPGLFDRFRDCRERPPQHTFFFPQDEYRPEYLDRLRKLCDAGFGDVDVHLHHDGDTADGFREKLERFRDALADRHGLLRRDPLTGRIVYGFIHGNWALCNSRPDGRWCGVNEEIDVLLRTGCYADFTMPSAPSSTQTRTINSIYYARQRPGPKSHDTGVPAAVGQPSPEDALLMIQGPLCLDWSSRKWGILPRTENGDIHAGFLPTLSRFRRWLDAAVHVWGRPDWVFVKLHTHGCKDGNRQAWLGERTQRFHRQLADLRARCPALRLYYVTAWEMACLVHQAEAGLREPDLENLAAGWADRCTTGAEPQPDSDAPRRSAARTAPAPQA
ncbi:MAG: hypothetical protein D6725_01260, partial [Planctomycetota bacterium]